MGSRREDVYLHSDVAGLDNVEAANAVGSSKIVQLGQELGRGVLHIIDGHGVAILKVDSDVGGDIRGGLRGHTAGVHFLGRLL